MTTRRSYETGDTIVEMVMAFAIFSFAVVITTAIMNRGVALSQQSLEVTLVRQQMDSQAEIIRYLHDTHNAAWTSLVGTDATPGNGDDRITTNIMPLSSATCPNSATLGSASLRAFFITPNPSTPDAFTVSTITAANYGGATTYARVVYPTVASPTPTSQGIWVQIASAEGSTPAVPAYDVYIHGCWDVSGQTQPMTQGTIVRLYGR
jgi:type II secretory pathway pseudopilin PulG